MQNFAIKITAICVSTAVTTLMGFYFIIELSVGGLHKRIDDTNKRLELMQLQLQREIEYRVKTSSIVDENFIKSSLIKSSIENENYEFINVSSTNPVVKNEIDFIVKSNGKSAVAAKFIDGDNQNIFYKYRDGFFDKNGEALNGGFILNPTRTGVLSTRFGNIIDPFNGRETMHKGVDYRAARGTPVVATQSGKVLFSGRKGRYGKFIEIRHKGGVISRYAHLSRIEVKARQAVKRGQIIGQVGSTGRSTGPHLHFELLENNENIDPLAFEPVGPDYKLTGNELERFRDFIKASELISFVEPLFKGVEPKG